MAHPGLSDAGRRMNGVGGGELFGPDRLAAHARALAAREHLAAPTARRGGARRYGRGPLLARLRNTEAVLDDVRERLQDATRRGLDVSPAGTWLLDNFFVVAEQVREIRVNLPSGYYHGLPKLAGQDPFGGYPRVYEVAIELIAHTDGRLDAQNVDLMVREYQRVAPFTMGELWAMPAMLRMGLLENVRRMALRAARDVADIDAADRWVARFRNASAQQIDLARLLSEFVFRSPELTPAFLTRFLLQLRSQRADFTPLLWLEQWIAEDGMSVEEAVQRSTQRLSLTQLVMANSITSLRVVASFDWRSFFEASSVTEGILRSDPGRLYAGLTFETRDRYRHIVERLAKRSRRAEPDVARAAVAMAAASGSATPDDVVRHVGYYLVGDGAPRLEQAIAYRPPVGERMRRWATRHPSGVYFGALALSTLIALALLLTPLKGAATTGALVLAACLALIPASDAAIALVNQLVMSVLTPSRLSRLDFTSGVPRAHRTVVIVPLLLWNADAVCEALDRLEAQYLANRDAEVRFALLGDLTDATQEVVSGDAQIVSAAVRRIRALNAAYGIERPPFYLFIRPRRWNGSENAWMGWERKRGKLAEFNAYLRGGARDAFSTIEGDVSWLGSAQYVITLDADTVLPRGAASALIGTIAHPLNRAVYDERQGRVVRGYGILQPRVSISLESANRSRFAEIFAGHPGVDPYTTAVSDVYQDLFGTGTYTGKGIYDVDAFERATHGRFPENALLSHDLIEGAFARAGLVTDVEVFDDYPTRYLTAVRRNHRWIRGDWQLLPWLRMRVPGPTGPGASPLSAASRWKIVDNLRRSLVPVATLAWLLAGWTLLPGSAVLWTIAALAAMATPFAAPLLFAAARPPRGQSWRPYYAAAGRDALRGFAQFALAIVFLPHQAFVAGDAIVRTLGRMFVTHRHLLVWRTASQVERSDTNRLAEFWRAFAAVELFVVGIIIIDVVAATSPAARAPAGRAPAGVAYFIIAVLAVLWAAAPNVAYVLSDPPARRDLTLTAVERTAALRLARRHWQFFEHFVGDDTQWLTPDNFQETPTPVVAARTSPTNVGLQLLATVSAFDLGFITRTAMIERLERAFQTLGRLRRLHGHFYNWYALSDLRVLEPPYVSTVDSGNFAGHLIALAAACLEIAGAVDPDAPDEASRLRALAHQARDTAMAMDFRLVYDDARRLFAIGYDERSDKLDVSWYDLLASEARLASFVAVAKGDVSAEHWFRLGRSLTIADGATALVSWSGSMFEYLMPLLVMPSRPFSLLDQTHRAAVRRQIAYARTRGVPWGISESTYNLRDRHETYQYRVFGVPDLALKRGLARDLVVAPYAAALALLVVPHEALSNLAALERMGVLGEYGFRDAIDYTRPEPNEAPAIVRIFMAHHIGMSLVALDNALDVHQGEGVWARRFMADPVARAAGLLLDERVPRRYVAHRSQSDVPDDVPERQSRAGPVDREFTTADTPEPRVGMLGALPYCVLLTNAGSGYSRTNGMAVLRWRADATRDDTGQWIYVKDLSTSHVWSAAYQPTGTAPDSYRVTFATERIVFARRDGEVETSTEIVVVPREQAEIRRVTMTNRSVLAREIELTSYGEVVLAEPDADRAQPAFMNLFVETEWLPSSAALLASRRPRSAAEPRPWCAHVAAAGPEQVGEVTCETDRAQFLGRGRTARAPRALDPDADLSGTVGAVLDPVVALRVRVRLEAGRSATVAFTTIVAGDRDTAVLRADQYRDLRAADRAVALAWTEARVELRDLDVTPNDVVLYQELAGALLYPRAELRCSASERAKNRCGQRTLWAHGISGDWPIVLATITDAAGLGSVRQLLVAHKYWRMKGIVSDLVILNEKGPTYQQELQDQLTAIVVASSEGALIDKPGGVFLRRADVMPPDDRAMLRATARIHATCDGIGLGAIMQPSASDASPLPVRRETEDRPARTAPRPARAPAVQLRDETPPHADMPGNCFGHLTDRGDYEITVAGATVPPAPWANVIANPNAGFCVTERGGGYAWGENSYFYRLTPWHNDPVSDPFGEVLYLQDAATGFVWTPTPGPAAARDAGADTPVYTVRHAPGVSTFSHERDGIATELVLAMAQSDPVKISRLRIANRGPAARRLTLTSYVEWTLGAQREHTRHQLHTSRDESTGALFAENPFTDDFASCVAFSWISEPVSSWTASREEFVGRNRDLTAPAALERDGLSGTAGAGDDPCAALRVQIEIGPGETRDVVVLLGAVRGAEQARAIIRRQGPPAAAAASIDEAVRAWDARLSVITVRTPAPEFDVMLNRWALYQALSCRMWARAALYQSSGAYGFRDQLQDCMAFVYAAPDVARAHLLRAAGRQFREGDVQHWWHEPSGRGIRSRCSDDLVWLPFVADHYVRVTGDSSVWDERTPFLEMRSLDSGEQELYDQPTVSDETATLYAHCVRALDRACTAGAHGLPLMGSGDWNDGLNRVGAGGTGESVWVAWFLVATLRRVAEHAHARGDTDVAARFRLRADRYAAAVEREAWDGEWYRRAYFDDGTPLGSAMTDESQINAIAQSWAVISGGGDPVRAQNAMRAVGEHLVREDERLIMLLTPPFDHASHDPGYIMGYVPGVRENGAQYTHAALWTALAEARLGHGERAFHLLSLLNPLTHARTQVDVERYRVEPYAVCADVYTAKGHEGRGGWTWYTGSAAWSYRVALEATLGFTKRGASLTINPCVPDAWREFAISYRYGSSAYEITVQNPRGLATGVVSVTVDGRASADGAIALADDGAHHDVVVRMG